MTRIPDRYSLFVSDLFLYHGGVSDYTDNFAKQLFEKNRLKSVITPFPTDVKREYGIRRFNLNPKRKPSYIDKWWIGSKLVTFIYYCRLYFYSYRGLKKLKLEKENDCLIFTEYYTFQFDIIVFMTRLLGIRYAIIFHGLDLLCSKGPGFNHFDKNFTKADFIIYNSEATRSLALEFVQLKGRHEMILYPGIDLPELEKYLGTDLSSESYAKSKDGITFSTVSRLVKRKGIDLAIRIVYQVAKSHTSIRYFIAGSGEEEGKLRDLVKLLNAGGYIHFLGDISNEDKYALLRKSDYFLLPNHSVGNADFEGFGISCIEASFFGNIVIAGNHGGVKEAVLNGTTGFLFDFDDPSSIESAIESIDKCIENEDLRKRISKQGVEYVKSTYAWNKLIDHFIQCEREIFVASN